MTGKEDRVRRGFLVTGRVQGVGFRWATAERARSLGIQGAVWNRPDGAVEVHARGREDAVRALAAWLEEGPPAARVRRVEVVPAGPAAEEGEFVIRRGG